MIPVVSAAFRNGVGKSSKEAFVSVVAVSVSIQRAPLDAGAFSASIATERDGATCVFSGVVRNHNAGRAVRYLEYEGYEEMILDVFREIETHARTRWPITDLKIAHRLGRVEIGEPSVVVAAASPHRGDAFEACRYAIDTLKHRAPIWKKEFYEDGSEWLEGPGGCRHE
jgi:molybdopterin synthase catalytic subunit